MIGQTSKKVIDAGDELEARDEARRIKDERGGAALGTTRRGMPPGAKGFLFVSVAIVAVVAVTFSVQALRHRHKGDAKPSKEAEQTIQVSNPTKDFKPAPLGAAGAEGVGAEAGGGAAGEAAPIEPIDVTGQVASAQPAGGETVPALAGGGGSGPASARGGNVAPTPRPPTAAEIVHLRRLQSDMGNVDSPARARVVQASADDRAGDQAQEGQGELVQQLKPMRLTSQRAGNLGDRNLLLTQGSMLDCALETRIVSTVAGMVSCHLTRDVYSANGKVILLDRGSKVVGFYQGGVKQGQPRIFVQWTRVETTKGVIVNIDSPGTGALGEAGVNGKIDTHFRDRFGGAILMSAIGDLGDYFANKNQGSSVQFSNSSDAAQELAKVTLENSINIPPTLTKNQGERISIFVARDLDFRGVYALSRR